MSYTIGGKKFLGAVPPWGVIGVGVVIFLLKDILPPLLISLFIFSAIDAVSRRLQIWAPAFGPNLAFIVATVVVLLLIIAGVAALAIHIIGTLRNIYEHSKGSWAEISRTLPASFAALKIGGGGGAGPSMLSAGTVVAAGRKLFAGLLMVLLYLSFLIGGRSRLAQKLFGLHPEGDHIRAATAWLRGISSDIEKYILTQAVVCGAFALAAGLMIYLAGGPDPVTWAIAIFGLGFVPYIGVTIGMVVPPLALLVAHYPVAHVLALAAGLGAAHLLTRHYLANIIQSRALGVEPLVLIFGVGLWGLIFGPVGVFLSTPLTMVSLAALRQVTTARTFSYALSMSSVDAQDRP